MELNSKLLNEKVALVTGCSRGIGLAILKTFAENGAIVYACDIQKDTLNLISTQLSEKYSTQIIPVYFDVTDVNAIKETISKINKECHKLDCIVNNAGIMDDALIGMVTEKNMNRTFAVNVFAVINLIQYASKLMKRQNSGSIINISSIVGINGNPGQIVYSASKGAVISLTKTAAKELASSNIRVNAIAPGMINTDMFRSIGEERMNERISKIALGRLGSPEDIANTALFLASDLSRYVTGQIIGVDGAAVI